MSKDPIDMLRFLAIGLKIHSPFKHHIIGDIESVMRELIILSTIYGKVEYEIYEVDKEEAKKEYEDMTQEMISKRRNNE